MFRLLNADLNRVLKSKGYWISLAIMTALSLGMTYMYSTQGGKDPEIFIQGAQAAIGQVGSAWIIMTILFTMFNHDLKSRVHQAAVGNGISRPIVVLTKYVEAAFLSALDVVILIAFVFGMSLVLGVSLSGANVHTLIMTGLAAWIGIVVVTAVSFIPVFAIGNLTVAALMAFAIPLGLISQAISLAGAAIHVDIAQYGIYANLDKVSEMLTNGPFNAWPCLLLAVWVVVGLGLTAFFYKKKELDF